MYAGPFVCAQGPRSQFKTIGWCCCTASWILVDVCEDHIETGKNVYVFLIQTLIASNKHKHAICSHVKNVGLCVEANI